EQQADRRHQQVVHERGDDRRERRTDHEADGEVDHVAANDERPEFVEHGPPSKMDCYFFEIRNRPSARCGSPERSKVSTASAGEPTSGSPCRLNEVFRTAPVPVRRSNSRITRWE